jgi:hypothetical protein
MADLAGVDRGTITAWSRRSTQLREWAAHNLQTVDQPMTAAQLAAAQKATRPAKPEESSPGRSCWRSGALMRAAGTWTAQPLTPRVRRGAHLRAPPFRHRAHPECCQQD